MPVHERRFDPSALKVLVGGESILEAARLNIQSREDAVDFIAGYGFDLSNPEHDRQIWSAHRRAVTYLQSEILRPNVGERMPEELSDTNLLQDPAKLLIYASMRGHKYQTWACAILKVMHIYVHLENDLFAQFQTQIQEQILKPIEDEIHEDPVLGITLGPTMGKNSILLKNFDVKNFKSLNSSVTKLLAKRDIVAFNILDKIGVRIVTKRLIDVFKVLSYFLEKHVVSFPHNIADQTNNTIFPLPLFLETLESLSRDHDYSDEELDELLSQRLQESGEKYGFITKRSDFSSADYRFIKFITRRLIRIPSNDGQAKGLSFFYPFEVQIVDYETHLKNMTGDAAHANYKERQIRKARMRLFGFNSPDEVIQ